jgi:hypothetical protein
MSKAGSTVLALGLVLMLSGIIFALQGYGVIGGSFMTGNVFWLYAGAGIALFGLAVTALGLIMRIGFPGKKA